MDQAPRHAPRTERTPDTMYSPTIAELFCDAKRAEAVWPSLFADYPELHEQLAQHKEHVDAVYEFISDPSAAIPVEMLDSHGSLNQQKATRFYEATCTLLGNPESRRLLLYLPFESLPPSTWQPSSSQLAHAADRFRDAYIDAWYHLLTMQDIRANFDDGDLLELEHRSTEPERVVKAAHLLPMLVERGILHASEALRLYAITPDPIMKKSLAEAIAVMGDIGMVSKEQMESVVSEAVTLGKIPHPSNYVVSDGRAKWLERQAAEVALQRDARTVAVALQEGRLPECEPATFIEAIVRATTDAHSDQSEAAIHFAELFEHTANNLLADPHTPHAERIARAARALYAMELIPRHILDTYLATNSCMIDKPRVYTAQQAQELEDVTKQLRDITHNPTLNEAFFPVAIAFGSRIKGYATQSSDVDIALIAQPGIPMTTRAELEGMITKITSEPPVVLYPEAGADTHLYLPEHMGTSSHTIDKYWVHILVNGAWVGNPSDVSRLQERMLARYFLEADTEERSRYIERLEQDTLQYRLMHEGYRRHFPVSPYLTTDHTPVIDGGSTFWDSGYRRLATKLFINTVFLPRLGTTK